MMGKALFTVSRQTYVVKNGVRNFSGLRLHAATGICIDPSAVEFNDEEDGGACCTLRSGLVCVLNAEGNHIQTTDLGPEPQD